MNNEEVLVIKANIALQSKQFENLREYILKSIETGMVFLPYYCEAIIIPKDLKIKVENSTLKETKENV